MADTSKSSRERAESAFGKIQSQSLQRNRTLSENDAAIQARNEKTSRLRAQRLAKEAEDLGTAPKTEDSK